jgi:anti-sigma regulatory factor (Ser/Thr protein kinase)
MSEHSGSGDSDLAVALVRRDADLCVLAVSGELSSRSAGLLAAGLSKSLADTGRVLVDVSGLWVSWLPAVQVFPSVLARMGGWPGERLVVFGADPDLAGALRALRVSAMVPVAPDEATARWLLMRRPPTVARQIDLERALASARRARLVVDAACADWQLDDPIRDDAVIVASELVANAVVHAGTGCRLSIRYKAQGLTIAVRDYRPDRMPPLRVVEAESQRGHGLFTVAAISLHWGITPALDGKTVWAFLPVTGSATYTHAIRQAAHDAVRAVLAYGASSPYAATAIRRLAGHLARQHGESAVRALVAELAHDLNEATAIIALMNEPDPAQRDQHLDPRPPGPAER